MLNKFKEVMYLECLSSKECCSSKSTRPRPVLVGIDLIYNTNRKKYSLSPGSREYELALFVRFIVNQGFHKAS